MQSSRDFGGENTMFLDDTVVMGQGNKMNKNAIGIDQTMLEGDKTFVKNFNGNLNNRVSLNYDSFE